MYNKENIKQEALKSIRYIIPIVFVFIGILALDNYSAISNSIISNISTIKGILAPLFIGFIIAYILNQPMSFLEKKFNLKRGLSVAIIYVTLAVSFVPYINFISCICSPIMPSWKLIPAGRYSSLIGLKPYVFSLSL